jgi:hypothetical protein
MKRSIIGLIGSIVTATALVAAQTPAQDPQKPQDQTKAPDLTVTGCLTQGTGPTVFVLGNAKMDAMDKTETAKSYVLVASTEDLAFASHVNHEVTVTGASDGKIAPAAPAGQKVSEKDLPKLTTKSLTEIADRCTAASR